MKIVSPSVHLVDFQGSDLSVVNAARVSFNKESEWELSSGPKFKGDATYNILSEKDQKLIS